MKKHYLSFTLLFGLIGLTGLLWNCSDPIESPLEEEGISEKMLPHEWMYAQRAYPNNFINKKAINEAFSITKNARAAEKSMLSGSWEGAGPTNVGTCAWQPSTMVEQTHPIHGPIC